MSHWLSPERLALVAEEILPELETLGSDELADVGRCQECGADVCTQGCRACQFPDDYHDGI